jgi:hypothetical protein
MQPFILTIEPQPNNEVVATIAQQPFPAKRQGRTLPFNPLESITGLPFVTLSDEILAALRANHKKPAVLKSRRPIELDEPSGIRLALLFKAIAPLCTVEAIQAMIRRIGAMRKSTTGLPSVTARRLLRASMPFVCCTAWKWSR